jgi:eukaryotic-like serine/threonine-protein kinase
LALALGVLVWIQKGQATPAAEPVRFQLVSPETYSLVGAPVVSPDGRKVAFVASDVNNRRTVWVRSLDALDAKQVTSVNEEGVLDPFWSFDSRFVGYAADGKLKRVEATGGSPQSLCDIGGVFTGGAWNRAGLIVYAQWSSSADNGGLWSVADSGGVPTQLAAIPSPEDAGAGYAFDPTFLPDGEHFLYVQYSAENAAVASFGVYLSSVAGMRSKQPAQRLLSSSSQVLFAPSPADNNLGHLLFLRDNALYSQPFDASRLAITGDAIALIASVGAGAPGQGEAGLQQRVLLDLL